MAIELESYGRSGLSLVVWRGIERLAAGLIVIALAPLLALIWVGIRLDSSGPAIFAQDRLGQNGEAFRMYKFRTMAHDADAGIPQHRRAVIESDRDPRITRVGRLLRRTSLDELPQLWNVVKGEMSLVGPRPILPEQRAALPARGWRRLAARPGLTGLAQVMGRRSLSWPRTIGWDCVFVRKDSVRLRLWIVGRTIALLWRPTKVYGDTGRNWRAFLPPELES